MSHLLEPVLVLKIKTERPETIEAGTVTKVVNPYGDGHSSERIVEAILNTK